MIQSPYIPKTFEAITVCAWCSEDTYPDLHDGEEYTHGMCEEHLRKLRRILERKYHLSP